ncbi:glucoamylase family protein [Novosphingobium sp.]|uniref:glucoamylase family protein n=1 Tax=Novosphingobium sp. TaxID=1874826 RepID=UPI003342C31A
MTIDRRHLLGGMASGLASSMASGAFSRATLAAAATVNPAMPPLIADIERRTFRFFRDLVNPANGLFPDRWPASGQVAGIAAADNLHGGFASIAAVGFALNAWPIGVERGWMSRAEARALTLATLRFFDRAPSGPDATGVSGHRGFFYHFLDMQTGLRFGNCELSTVDTALLHLGMLFASGWFDDASPEEAEIRRLATTIVDRAQWDWAQPKGAGISMGWHPETGFIERIWDGYNEGKMVYVLALGSGAHPIGDNGWDSWTAPYARFWRGEGASRHLAFAPLFGHQYSETWIDFRGIRDAPMRAAGFDYFENSRRATYANRAYCAANPMQWRGYSDTIWGLAACDGPGNHAVDYHGRPAQFLGYAARGPVGQPDGQDDGTIAPTAALGSIAFAPEIVIPAAQALARYAGGRLYGRYGFVDAFNPSFRDTTLPVENGTVDATFGWVGGDCLGIDQGPILSMIANHRDGLIWNVMRRVPHIRRGLTRAGFTGGWLDR